MALRVMRTGSVTECYLEPLAAILQSMRITKRGQGWRRFLVFAELTKSKKGVNYIALFVYFQFKSALIVILAQGPRIAINAMTLYAVMQAQLIPGGDHSAKDRSNFEQFFFNIKVMVERGNKQETVVYFTMLFSLVIWVIAALGLIVSALLYIFFLWHYIPRADGSLTNYCRRKVETRLERIVSKKVKKAIEKQDQQRRKEEQKAIKKGRLDPSQTRPTLPKLGGDDDDTATVFSLQRSDTISTTTTAPPQYTSHAPSRSNTMNTTRGMMKPPLAALSERPDMPNRSDTEFSNFSNVSYGSNAPLMNQGNRMGTSTPPPPMPQMDRNGDYFGESGRPFAAPGRSYTPMSQGRASPMPPRGPMPPVDTSYGNGPYESGSHVTSASRHDPRGPSSAQSYRPYPEFSPFDSRGPQIGPSYELSPVEATATDILDDYYSNPTDVGQYKPPQMPSALRPGSPAVSQSAGLSNQPRAGTAPPPPRSGTAPPRPGLPASLQSAIQRREASQPLPNRGMNSSTPQQRSATAPIQQPSWNSGPIPRSYTPSERSYTPASQAPPRGHENNYGY